MESGYETVLTWVTALFGLLGLGCFWFYFRSRAKARKRRGWPTAEGTVISSEVEYISGRVGDHHSHKNYRPQVRYRYRVQGEELEGNCISKMLRYLLLYSFSAQKIVDAYPPGSRVRVFYEPGNPVNCYLEPGKGNHVLFAAGILLMCMVAASGWMLLAAGSEEWFPEPRAVPDSAPEPALDPAVESAEQILARLDKQAEADLKRPKRADLPAPPQADQGTDLMRRYAVEMVAAHRAAGHGLDELDPMGKTLLHRAADGCRVPVINTLLTAGAKPDVRTPGGSTGLHLVAVRSDCEAGARALIDAGADLNARDPQGHTALFLAIANERSDMAQLLVERGTDPNLAEASSKTTPLHLAAQGGDRDLARALLSKGAELERLDAEGNTPLHLAARHGRDQVVRLLLLSGADMSAQDAQGRTATELATQRGHTQLGLRMRAFSKSAAQ